MQVKQPNIRKIADFFIITNNNEFELIYISRLSLFLFLLLLETNVEKFRTIISYHYQYLSKTSVKSDLMCNPFIPR